MSVGCTRLLLANGTAPDRSLSLPSRTLTDAGSPGRRHRVICALGSAHHLHLRLIRHPHSAWPPEPATACPIPEQCATVRGGASQVSIWDRLLSLTRLIARRGQLSRAEPVKDTRSGVNFSERDA